MTTRNSRVYHYGKPINTLTEKELDHHIEYLLISMAQTIYYSKRENCHRLDTEVVEEVRNCANNYNFILEVYISAWEALTGKDHPFYEYNEGGG